MRAFLGVGHVTPPGAVLARVQQQRPCVHPRWRSQGISALREARKRLERSRSSYPRLMPPAGLVLRARLKAIQMSSAERVAALYDIHGNFPALDAVPEEVESRTRCKTLLTRPNEFERVVLQTPASALPLASIVHLSR